MKRANQKSNMMKKTFTDFQKTNEWILMSFVEQQSYQFNMEMEIRYQIHREIYFKEFGVYFPTDIISAQEIRDMRKLTKEISIKVEREMNDINGLNSFKKSANKPKQANLNCLFS